MSVAYLSHANKLTDGNSLCKGNLARVCWLRLRNRSHLKCSPKYARMALTTNNEVEISVQEFERMFSLWKNGSSSAFKQRTMLTIKLSLYCLKTEG